MQTRHATSAAPSVVVGIDGSPAARDAAVWAIDEAISRDIPLRLVYVVDPVEPRCDTAQAALYDAQRVVESTGEAVKVETEVRHGTPLTELRRLSRSAALVCVGSLGAEHARHHDGSVAAALAASACCPVAVIRHSPSPLSGEAGRVVADARCPESDAVLEYAFAEARLREAPLRIVTRCAGQTARRLDGWIRRHPDVQVETITAHDTADPAGTASAVQLVVTAAGGPMRPGSQGHSVLTVHAQHL